MIGLKKVRETVKHVMEILPISRSNDTYLFFNVMEREEYATYLAHTRYGPGWFIKEKDVLSEEIPPGHGETIRRSRQLIQQHGNLLPSDSVLKSRRDAELETRNQIKLINEPLTIKGGP